MNVYFSGFKTATQLILCVPGIMMILFRGSRRLSVFHVLFMRPNLWDLFSDSKVNLNLKIKSNQEYVVLYT